MIRRLFYRVAHSLSTRLLGIFLLTSIVYAFSARFAVDLVLDRDYLREVVGSHVALHTTYLLQDIGLPPSIERAAEIAASNPLDIRITGPYVDWASDPAFPDLRGVDFAPSSYFDYVERDVFETPDGRDVLSAMGFARYQGHSFVRIELADYEILLASPKVSVHPGSDLTAPVLIGLVSILVLSACFFAVSWLIRPINWIKDGAMKIGQGDLDYRIPARRTDDLGSLTVEINRMADDVQGMLEAKRQMLLAISHELRSPLTRTRVALEFLDDDATRQSILDDVTEMENLVTDLLESERLNTRHSKLQISSVDVVRLIDDLVRNDFQDQRPRIDVRMPAKPVTMDIDETRIRLLVKNLIDNALCYTPVDGDRIVVQIEPCPDSVAITVADRGPGMSAEEVERATEPFYRADPARCRDTGGFGLGLYLCRRIAEAHGGTLRLDSEAGVGTSVTLTLPRSAGDGAD